MKSKKPAVVLGKVIATTPGGRHIWCESSAGKIRKPCEALCKKAESTAHECTCGHKCTCDHHHEEAPAAEAPKVEAPA